MRMPLLRPILLLVVAGLAACSKNSPTTPTTAPAPTRFTVFASDRGRAVGSFRNFITGFDVTGTVEFVIGTAPGIVDRHPSITGDGNLLVYQSSPGRGGSQDVFGYNRTSGQLTDDSNVNTTANETDPYISLDGRRLAFVRDTLGTRRIRLYDTQSQRLIPLAGLEGAAGSTRLGARARRAGPAPGVRFRSSGQSRRVSLQRRHPITVELWRADFGQRRRRALDIRRRTLRVLASSRAGGMGGYDLFLFDRITSQLVTLSTNSASSDRDPSIS